MVPLSPQKECINSSFHSRDVFLFLKSNFISQKISQGVLYICKNTLTDTLTMINDISIIPLRHKKQQYVSAYPRKQQLLPLNSLFSFCISYCLHKVKKIDSVAQVFILYHDIIHDIITLKVESGHPFASMNHHNNVL